MVAICGVSPATPDTPRGNYPGSCGLYTVIITNIFHLKEVHIQGSLLTVYLLIVCNFGGMKLEYPVDVVMDRYCFYRKKYVMMINDMIRAMPYKYGRKQVWEHLNGNIAMCVYAGPSVTKFLTLDVDLHDPSVVRKVIETMVELGIPSDKIYVSESGGKGYHVDIFFEEGIYNWKAKELYDLIIYFSGCSKRKVEYRPTPGQSIKLPLGIHQRTGRRCWFVDRETLEPIEDFNYICGTEKIDPGLIDSILKSGNSRRFSELIIEARDNKTEKPVRKKAVGEIRIEETGTRQSKMVEEALRLFRDGGDENSIRRDLEEWLLKQDRALYSDSMDECMRNISNITKWVMKHGIRNNAKHDPNQERPARVRIYESDIRRIFTAPTKSARMLAFLFTVYCDLFGVCGLSAEKICKILSIRSNKTVVEASKWIEESGIFCKQKGGCKNTGNKLCFVTNKYAFPDDYRREGRCVEINGYINEETFREKYYSTLAKMCSKKELSGVLSRGEMRDVGG